MSGADLSFAVAELAPFAGKRIAKIRKTEEGVYLFKIGSEELLFQPGVRFHLTRQVHQATEAPDGFVAFLRKNLEGKTAQVIAQWGVDRVVEITTRSKEKLIFELFRKGNIIYVDESGAILACSNTEESGGRKIGRGEKYEYPKATQFEQKLPEKIAFVVQENEKGEPTSFSIDAAKGGKEFPTFSEAADYYYANQTEESEGQAAAEGRMKKLQARLASQRETLARMEKERGGVKEKGDAIYANFEKVEQLLALVKRMKKEGKKEEEIAREIEKYGAKISGSELEVEL